MKGESFHQISWEEVMGTRLEFSRGERKEMMKEREKEEMSGKMTGQELGMLREGKTARLLE